MMFPFFLWLDWRGWLRADALDELVGLDTSYHGGLHLLTSDPNRDNVSATAIDAYKQRKAERTQARRTDHGGSAASSSFEETNGDDDPAEAKSNKDNCTKGGGSSAFFSKEIVTGSDTAASQVDL